MGVGGIVTTAVGAAIGLLVLAAVLPLVFQGTNDAAASLNDPNVTTGSEEADSLKGIYAIVLGFGAVLLIGGIAFGLVKFKGGAM